MKEPDINLDAALTAESEIDDYEDQLANRRGIGEVDGRGQSLLTILRDQYRVMQELRLAMAETATRLQILETDFRLYIDQVKAWNTVPSGTVTF